MMLSLPKGPCIVPVVCYMFQCNNEVKVLNFVDFVQIFMEFEEFSKTQHFLQDGGGKIMKKKTVLCFTFNVLRTVQA